MSDAIAYFHELNGSLCQILSAGLCTVAGTRDWRDLVAWAAARARVRVPRDLRSWNQQSISLKIESFTFRMAPYLSKFNFERTS